MTADQLTRPSDAFASAAERLLHRCDVLGGFSALSDGILRAYLTPEHAKANAQVAEWMEEAGMSTWQDAVGNQWGRYEGIEADAKTLVLGSHLDTVPYAGRYDGILGVLAAVELVADLHGRGERLPFAIEIVGFCDEEGTRFGATLIGSKALAGQWNDDWMQLQDDDGISMWSALQAFGLDPHNVRDAALNPDQLLGFWEIHIEQGPVLESLDLPVGVVTGIAGARRANIRLTGQAGHAGTTPMHLRRDALVGAAEVALAVEEIAKRAGGDIVATVGQLFARPGAVNVIAGGAMLSLDVRSQSDDERDRVLEEINDATETIAARRNLDMMWEWQHSAGAVLCDDGFQAVFAQAIADEDIIAQHLPSGAGHDAMAVAEITPMAMLFLRSPRGLSHHPDEAVIEDDVAITLSVMARALKALAST
ncbi:allantoate amidohydrolase [Marinibactrum halimedae]|uniref:Zn-dependent hydrolase n=1 Tax=Marinibactrum halimedae TaxID=1444977 RepID=A0AA37WLL4_9GAMM|nr:allantoate amidohydrolase [Marinibactrum halimedae]MCD9459687.1 allantoate amidohydrolase [Marinibactrum halimedae]GLS25713.1 Zn-dependent hydrolase [Marinibactrum halimedae]